MTVVVRGKHIHVDGSVNICSCEDGHQYVVFTDENGTEYNVPYEDFALTFED